VCATLTHIRDWDGVVWSIGTAECTDRLSEYPPRRAIETRPRITHRDSGSTRPPCR